MEILVGRKFAEKLQIAICKAQKTIKMIVFCWSIREEKKCDELLKINNAFRHAIARGVTVFCMSGSEGLTRQLLAMGIKAKLVSSFKITHAKFILLDDTIFFIGSHNLTKCAMQSNLEVSIVGSWHDVDNEQKLFFDRLWDSLNH